MQTGRLAQLLTHAIGAGSFGFKSRAGQIGAVSPMAIFLRSCVAQALTAAEMGPVTRYMLRRNTTTTVKI